MKTKTKIATKTRPAQDKRALAKKSPKPNGQAATSAKKLSQIAAALEVMKTATEPMTCKQLVEAMAERKLWSSPGGKTPEATLYASLMREIAKKGDVARFVKAAPGRFAATA